MRHRPLLSLLVLTGLLLAAPVWAEESPAPAASPAPAVAPTPDKLFLRGTCIACHGKEGKKAIQAYPNLAGQDKIYLLNQIKDIAAERRVGSPDDTGNPRTKGMKDILHLLQEADQERIAEWLAKLAPVRAPAPAEPIAPERLAKGAELYTKSNCTTCHGKEGKKPLAAHPHLAGQKKEYLVIQMRDIKDGIRKNGKSATMKPFVAKLGEEDMKQIAEYLAQVDPTP